MKRVPRNVSEANNAQGGLAEGKAWSGYEREPGEIKRGSGRTELSCGDDEQACMLERHMGSGLVSKTEGGKIWSGESSDRKIRSG